MLLSYSLYPRSGELQFQFQTLEGTLVLQGKWTDGRIDRQRQTASHVVNSKMLEVKCVE